MRRIIAVVVLAVAMTWVMPTPAVGVGCPWVRLDDYQNLCCFRILSAGLHAGWFTATANYDTTPNWAPGAIRHLNGLANNVQWAWNTCPGLSDRVEARGTRDSRGRLLPDPPKTVQEGVCAWQSWPGMQRKCAEVAGWIRAPQPYESPRFDPFNWGWQVRRDWVLGLQGVGLQQPTRVDVGRSTTCAQFYWTIGYHVGLADLALKAALQVGGDGPMGLVYERSARLWGLEIISDLFDDLDGLRAETMRLETLGSGNWCVHLWDRRLDIFEECNLSSLDPLLPPGIELPDPRDLPRLSIRGALFELWEARAGQRRMDNLQLAVWTECLKQKIRSMLVSGEPTLTLRPCPGWRYVRTQPARRAMEQRQENLAQVPGLDPLPTPLPPSAPPPPPAPGPGGAAGGTITVVRASYGGNCRHQPSCKWLGRTEANTFREGNVTGHTAGACNGKAVCEYVTDYFDSRTYQSKGVVEDPCIGCVKDYEVEWHCGDPSKTQRKSVGGDNDAGLGAVVTLSCAEAGSSGGAQPAAATSDRYTLFGRTFDCGAERYKRWEDCVNTRCSAESSEDSRCSADCDREAQQWFEKCEAEGGSRPNR